MVNWSHFKWRQTNTSLDREREILSLSPDLRNEINVKEETRTSGCQANKVIINGLDVCVIFIRLSGLCACCCEFVPPRH